jgi:hypothetical protein
MPQVVQQNCKLLALPAELRNCIWTLSFTHDESPINLFTALTTKGPSGNLLITCHQIHDEAVKIYKQARMDYWSTGRFELHFDTSKDRIACVSDARLKQINHLTIHGRIESYIFTSGAWSCSKLYKQDGIPRHSVTKGTCPDAAIHGMGEEAPRAALRGGYILCDSNCRNHYIKHNFVNVGADADLEKEQKDLGWVGLTKDELMVMLRWYTMVVKPHREEKILSRSDF